MKSFWLSCLFSALLSLFTCAHAQVDWPQFNVIEVPGDYLAPVHVTSARDGSDRLFIVEQEGRITIVQSNSLQVTPFLDISDRVSNPPNTLFGLLSVAFPTNYAAKGYFYVYYSRTNDQASVISRFFTSSNANQALASSEQVILVVTNVFCYTLLGGQLAFGPDGYLYISTGSDEACSNVPESQRSDSLWGKLLRIDVETSTNAYLIPTNNPFVGNPSFRPEIWAMGLRNPWRFSFDRQTGDLFIGDVGQNIFEEINIQTNGSPGGQNYGWPLLEGTTPVFYYENTGTNAGTLTPPSFGYPHAGVAFPASVTGGFVYRGPNSPRLNEVYVFADFYASSLNAAARSGSNWVMQTIPIGTHFISSFGEDDAGRLYFVDYLFGKLFRLEDNGLTGPPVFNPPGTNSHLEIITITSSTPGATIHYTTNGLTPTISDPSLSSGGQVVITQGMTLQARAFRTGLLPSTITAITFTLETGAPVFSPPHGPITNGTLVSMSSSTPGAVIRYTLDGTDPTGGSPLYTGPVSINISNTVSARAFKAGFMDSPITRIFFAGPLVLSTVQHQAGNSYFFSFLSDSVSIYQIQFSSDMVNWLDTPYPLFGNGQVLNFYFLTDTQKRFFRVRID